MVWTAILVVLAAALDGVAYRSCILYEAGGVSVTYRGVQLNVPPPMLMSSLLGQTLYDVWRPSPGRVYE